jgi:hypothetical protein
MTTAAMSITVGPSATMHTTLPSLKRNFHLTAPPDDQYSDQSTGPPPLNLRVPMNFAYGLEATMRNLTFANTTTSWNFDIPIEDNLTGKASFLDAVTEFRWNMTNIPFDSRYRANSSELVVDRYSCPVTGDFITRCSYTTNIWSQNPNGSSGTTSAKIIPLFTLFPVYATSDDTVSAGTIPKFNRSYTGPLPTETSSSKTSSSPKILRK